MLKVNNYLYTKNENLNIAAIQIQLLYFTLMCSMLKANNY